ncbi:ABC transporter permease [Priestia sp. HNGD-A6]|uniref:ABC transporter permease n=1 Tax=Priestia sp. HNGD-A6 TaxID=3092666 RepID=UPI0038924999
MKNIMWLVTNMLRNMLLRNKRTLVLVIGLPIAGILMSVLIYGNTAGTSVNIGVVNHDSTDISKDTVQFLKGLHKTNVKMLTDKEVDHEITSKKVDAVITFEKGFFESVKANKPDHITITSIKGAEVTGFIKSYLYQYIDNVSALNQAAGGNDAAFKQMYESYQKAPFHVSTHALEDKGTDQNIVKQTIGYLIMFMLFSAVNLSALITKEKEQRTYFRLLASPVSARQYVISNVMTNMILLTLQVMITLVCITTLFHVDMNIPVWQLFFILVLFGLVAIGLSLVIIAFTESSKAANGLQTLIITPTCLLSGCFFPPEFMPDVMQKIADFLPQTWVLSTLKSVQQGAALSSLWLNISILLAFALVFFLLSIYKLNRNNTVQKFI